MIQTGIVVMKSTRALEWESFDGKPVQIMIALIVPKENYGNEHIQILASLSRMLMKQDFRRKLTESDSAEEIFEVIHQAGGRGVKDFGVREGGALRPATRYASSAGSVRLDDRIKKEKRGKAMAKKKLVALCACTMGLAHTFMAAQALEDAAKELGYDVKVETQGADGIQNELTPAEIADADIIIHAVALAPQNNERFDSYDIYEIGLQDAIKNAKGIIQEIESMEG